MMISLAYLYWFIGIKMYIFSIAYMSHSFVIFLTVLQYRKPDALYIKLKNRVAAVASIPK